MEKYRSESSQFSTGTVMSALVCPAGMVRVPDSAVLIDACYSTSIDSRIGCGYRLAHAAWNADMGNNIAGVIGNFLAGRLERKVGGIDGDRFGKHGSHVEVRRAGRAWRIIVGINMWLR